MANERWAPLLAKDRRAFPSVVFILLAGSSARRSLAKNQISSGGYPTEGFMIFRPWRCLGSQEERTQHIEKPHNSTQWGINTGCWRGHAGNLALHHCWMVSNPSQLVSGASVINGNWLNTLMAKLHDTHVITTPNLHEVKLVWKQHRHCKT